MAGDVTGTASVEQQNLYAVATAAQALQKALENAIPALQAIPGATNGLAMLEALNAALSPAIVGPIISASNVATEMSQQTG